MSEKQENHSSPAPRTRTRRPRKSPAEKLIVEGRTTRMIEAQTARVPSVDWFALAVGSMALSAITTLVFERRSLGNFFGLWAPSLLLIGVYNKLVKVEAHLTHH